MADAFITNQIPTAYGTCLWLLINMLRSAGWTIQASGDGLAAYSSTSSVFSNSGATGANGFGNVKAWARMQDPSAGREYIFQHDNAGGFRFKYSPSAKFTGGAGSATQTPSATDEQYICGAASDAVPTYKATFISGNVTTGKTRFQGGARASAPYGWWFAGATLAGVNTLTTGLMMDPLIGPTQDPDPVAFYVDNSSPFQYTDLSNNLVTLGASNNAVMGFMDTAKTVWICIVASAYYAGAVVLSGTSGAVNPFSGMVDGGPILYYRPGNQITAQGPKGWSTIMKWTMVPKITFVDTASFLSWICVGHVWLFWDGATYPSN